MEKCLDKQREFRKVHFFQLLVVVTLFYGQLDRETEILDFPSLDDLLIRYVDDFVIISA